MPLRLVLWCAAAVLLAACGQPVEPAQQSDVSGPLEALPPCEPPPPSSGDTVKGLIVPEGTIITGVTPSKPLVNVTGYIEQTPIAFEAAYAERDDITILSSENEIFEAEMLISDGKYRNFLKAAAACRTGSQLLIVVAPEIEAKGLPTPQRGLTTPTPTPTPTPSG